MAPKLDARDVVFQCQVRSFRLRQSLDVTPRGLVWYADPFLSKLSRCLGRWAARVNRIISAHY